MDFNIYMIGFILRPLLSIISYVIALYLMDFYGFLFGIEFIHNAANTSQLIKVYLIIGIIFRFWFSVLKFILNIITLPIQYMTLWIVWWLTNIVVMYICQFIINFYLTGIEMKIISVSGIIMTSFVLSIVVSLIYWVLKKIL